MARRSILDEDEQTDINLSPMIDCIFILLIFFIVTTVFVEETGLQVHKPDAAAAPSTEENESLTVEIAKDGRILLDRREIGLGQLPGEIKNRVANGDVPVVIRSHEKARHGVFVSVWDAARRGGAETLTFTTVH